MATAAPKAPPTVRMTVLMPVAIPTWDCGTAPTIRLAIDAKANEMPAPSSTPAITKSHSCPCCGVSTTNAAVAKPAPIASVVRKPIVAPRRPASGPATSCATAAGKSSSPASVTDAPKP